MTLRRLIKSFLPRGLLGRALMIIITPLALVQIISAYEFYDELWDTLSWRLSLNVAGDLGYVADLVERSQDVTARQEVIDTIARDTGLRFTYREGGVVTGVRLLDRTAVSDKLANALGTTTHGRRFQVADRSPTGDVMVDLQLARGSIAATIPRKRLFSDSTTAFWIWQLGSSALLAGIAALFMRNQVRPIRRLAAQAERFGRGLDVSDAKASGATEVRRATVEFNRMRERILRQMAHRTEMLAGVSHDLRTPLTRLKLGLELLSDEPAVDELKADVADMETLVDGYLAFVRGEGGEMAVDSDLGALIDELAGRARSAGATIDVQIAGPIRLKLKPIAFRRSIGNLINNAVRYSRRIVISAASTGDGVELTVDDDGPGIPADQRDLVFRPFVRLDRSRNAATGGVGLGLTIARDLVRSHGGDLTLGESPQGGLRALVRLPLDA